MFSHKHARWTLQNICRLAFDHADSLPLRLVGRERYRLAGSVSFSLYSVPNTESNSRKKWDLLIHRDPTLNWRKRCTAIAMGLNFKVRSVYMLSDSMLRMQHLHESAWTEEHNLGARHTSEVNHCLACSVWAERRQELSFQKGNWHLVAFYCFSFLISMSLFNVQ